MAEHIVLLMYLYVIQIQKKHSERIKIILNG